jgi:IclR family transcriptional regulator, acetate operon repressor
MVDASLNIRPNGTQVRSVARGARWLLWIAQREAATATDVAREFGVPLPTVHHVLGTLVTAGLLAKDPARQYRMGPNIAVLAESFMRTQGVPSAWHGALAELAAATGESAYLAAWRGDDIRILVGIEGSRAVRAPDVRSGSYEHAHARAAGKLLLATAARERRNVYLALHPPLALTARTITDRRHLDAELDRVARRGYATDTEEFAEGLSCLSVPLIADGAVLGAFTVAAPAQRFRAERAMLLREAHRAAADAVGAQESHASPRATRAGRRP